MIINISQGKIPNQINNQQNQFNLNQQSLGSCSARKENSQFTVATQGVTSLYTHFAREYIPFVCSSLTLRVLIDAL